MKIIAYNLEEDSFFIGATFNEFLKLKEKYNFKDVGSSVELARQFVNEEKKNISEGNKSLLFDVIKECYGIDSVPDICFLADRNLSTLELWNICILLEICEMDTVCGKR